MQMTMTVVPALTQVDFQALFVVSLKKFNFVLTFVQR